MGRDKPWYHPYSEKNSALFDRLDADGYALLNHSFRRTLRC
ncbi:MAG: hypothetical protein UHL70_03535 [Acutalibacteraceae bacterium]|nr:hypothetical protein [Acutalibacteraceae bacterium]